MQLHEYYAIKYNFACNCMHMQIHVIGFSYYKLPKKCKNGKNG